MNKNNEIWHTSTGRVIYDPYRGNMKKKTNWWCVLEVDKEITRYYRYLVMKEKWIDLCQPSWDAHVSIIRGEKPKPHLMNLWKKYHGEICTFQYKHELRYSGDTTGHDRPGCYWFITVKSPELLYMRREFELPSDWNLHLTIGRTWY